MTRIAFGVPVLNGGAHLEEALESLLAQTHVDFGLVVMDNCSTDATSEIARRFAENDPRVRYRRNEETTGMVENWRRAYKATVEEFGALDYFAFGSDHDLWHREWLAALMHELETDEGVVLAYPLTVPMRPDGTTYESGMTRRRWDTATVADPYERVRLVALGGLRPGNTMHGLFRADALEQCGIVPSTVASDRLLMVQLAALGRFKQVPRELWLRRFWDTPRSSQRGRMFTGSRPLRAYLPISLVHATILANWAAVESPASPGAAWLGGIRFAFIYLQARATQNMQVRLRKMDKRMNKRYRRWVKKLRGLALKLRRKAREAVGGSRL
jgi:glycosyltransferase involved in cell wall biosynthesis